MGLQEFGLVHFWQARVPDTLGLWLLVQECQANKRPEENEQFLK